MFESERPRRFYPTRRRGSIFLGGLLILFILLAAVFFWLSSLTPVGWMFALYLAGGIIACLPLPMLSYRFFALFRAYYDLTRNSLTIHWGLRTEILPLGIIEWYRPLEDLTSPLATPPLALPGAYIGVRNVEGLGRVEYMADSFTNGLMIAVPHSVFILSPADHGGFLSAFHHGIEMGSLETIETVSIQPSFVLGKLWDDRLARNLVIASFGLGLVVILWTIYLITSVPLVTMGSIQTGPLVEKVPSIRLLLFPVVYGFIFLIDLIGGSFFYRREDEQYAAYLLWGGGVISAVLLIISLTMTTIHL
jgi:hypothetical protein